MTLIYYSILVLATLTSVVTAVLNMTLVQFVEVLILPPCKLI